MSDVGRPRFFDVDVYLSAVNGMINADEVERALWMLDNLPAYYRDNPPARALEMRERLQRQLWTPVQYAGIYAGAACDPATMAWPLRAERVEAWVRQHNLADRVPHVMELAPGGRWLEVGLKHKGLNFTYECMGLDEKEQLVGIQTGPVLFCAFEIIEHLADEQEIYRNYLKFERPADCVMLSTPLYTYAGGMDRWQDRELGHLRTYSVPEFHQVAAKMFRGFEWQAFCDDTIVLIGSRK